MTAEKGEGKQMERREVHRDFLTRWKGEENPVSSYSKTILVASIWMREQFLSMLNNYLVLSRSALHQMSAEFNTTANFVKCDENYFYSWASLEGTTCDVQILVGFNAPQLH